jgi:predicted kinase
MRSFQNLSKSPIIGFVRSSQTVDDLGRLRHSLGPLPEPVVRPSLVVVSGLPGTGKSYFCRRLAERTPVVILESDALRKVIFHSPSYSGEESAHLFQAIDRLAADLLAKGITPVVDATNLEEYHRERLYHVAEQRGARLIVVQIWAPPEVVHQRLLRRAGRKDPSDSSDADWQVYQRMRPNAETIRRNHFKVDTSRDIAPAVEKIAAIIDR